MAFSTLIFSIHARRRMIQWQINEDDVHHVLLAGEVLETYPDDTPYPSYLVLGWCGSKPVHIVAADNAAEQETIVITAYEPDPDKWDSDFRRKKL